MRWAIGKPVNMPSPSGPKGRDTPLKQLTTLTERMISGVGTYPVVGSYDDVVEQYRKMSECGRRWHRHRAGQLHH